VVIIKQLLKTFATLTEEDLDYDECKKSEMIENLQVRLRKNKRRADYNFGNNLKSRS
jgi:hypothetical protein